MGVRADMLVDLIVTSLFLAGALSLLWERWSGKVVSGARETVVGLFLLSGAGLANVTLSGVITGSELLTESAIRGTQGGLVIAGLGALALGFSKKKGRSNRDHGVVREPVVRELIESASTDSDGFAQLVLQFLPRFSTYLGCKVVSVRFYSPRENRWGRALSGIDVSPHQVLPTGTLANAERVTAELSILHYGHHMCEITLDFATRLQAALASQEIRFAELLLREEISSRTKQIRDWYLRSIQEITEASRQERGTMGSCLEVSKRFVSTTQTVLNARLVEAVVRDQGGNHVRITVGETGRVLVEKPGIPVRTMSGNFDKSIPTTEIPLDPKYGSAGHVHVVWKQTPRWIDLSLIQSAVAILARSIGAIAPEAPAPIFEDASAGQLELGVSRFGMRERPRVDALGRTSFTDHAVESAAQ